jgi:glycosyltransferase involved in cell wall biosynthesis
MINVAISFKNFASWTGISGLGLNVAAVTNARSLIQNGIHAVVFPVKNNIDLVNSIDEYNRENPSRKLTHVIISAPWLSKLDMTSLIEHYKDIQFVIESHSNVGFLQADPWGVKRLREAWELSKTHKNIRVAGNSKRFVEWARLVYDKNTVLLPNLYPLYPMEYHKRKQGDPLRIGVLGAIRPLKNFMSAAAAAIAIGKILDESVELRMSVGGEGDGGSVTNAIKAMVADVPNFTLVDQGWQPWEKFIEEIRKMDLLVSPSFTESFLMIVADGILVGVPSVVSSAVVWAPKSWKADSDDALDIARVGVALLKNSKSIKQGKKALTEHNRWAFGKWKEFLEKGEN